MGRTLVAQRSPCANVATTKCMIHWKIVNFYCSYGRKSYPWYILNKTHQVPYISQIFGPSFSSRTDLPVANEQSTKARSPGCFFCTRWLHLEMAMAPLQKNWIHVVQVSCGIWRFFFQSQVLLSIAILHVDHLQIYNLQISFVSSNQLVASVNSLGYVQESTKKRNPHSHGVFQL